MPYDYNVLRSSRIIQDLTIKIKKHMDAKEILFLEKVKESNIKGYDESTIQCYFESKK